MSGSLTARSSLTTSQTGAAIGAAIAAWWEAQEASRIAAERQHEASEQDSLPEQDTTQQPTEASSFYRQSTDDIFLVLARLGEQLLALKVINESALPEARRATSGAFLAGDPSNDTRRTFDSLNETVQDAITCAMVFCAECWPMHMWRGFGCGVLNRMDWAYPKNSSSNCTIVDNSVAALKSVPLETPLLTKSPTRISRKEPNCDQYTDSVKEKMLCVTKDIYSQFLKRGHPQPKSPYKNIKITSWRNVFATWGGNYLYREIGHTYEPFCTWQADPGRYLFAWTAGRWAELQPGEAIQIQGKHIEALAQWLEGLNGMHFKVLLENELDWSKIKISSSTKKLLGNTGAGVGCSNDPFVMVPKPRDPEPPVVQQVSEQIQNLNLTASRSNSSTNRTSLSNSTRRDSAADGDPVGDPDNAPPPYSAISPASPTSAAPPPIPQRRPLPVPPPIVLRTAKAAFAFTAETDEELSFGAEDTLEILDDASDDGWWKARLRGRTGLIPCTFLQ